MMMMLIIIIIKIIIITSDPDSNIIYGNNPHVTVTQSNKT